MPVPASVLPEPVSSSKVCLVSLGVRRKVVQALSFASEGLQILGSRRTPADVLEAAVGHALAQAQYLTEATLGGRAGRLRPC